MLWPCSAAAAIVLSSILAVPVCCGPSMADESPSYIEVGPFSNSRRMGRGASLTVGVLMQGMSRCPGQSLTPPSGASREHLACPGIPLRHPGHLSPVGYNPLGHLSEGATILPT